MNVTLRDSKSAQLRNPEITMYSTKGLVKLHRYIGVSLETNPRYNDIGEKQSQLSLYRGMGDKYVFNAQLI